MMGQQGCLSTKHLLYCDEIAFWIVDLWTEQQFSCIYKKSPMENYVFHVKEKINKATFIQMFPNIQYTACVEPQKQPRAFTHKIPKRGQNDKKK